MDTILSSNSKEQIREALELLQRTAKEERDQLRDLARNRYADLKAALGDARVSLNDEAGRLARLKERGEKKARAVAGRVDDYVHTEPWRLIAAAAACGVVVGLLLNRSRG